MKMLCQLSMGLPVQYLREIKILRVPADGTYFMGNRGQ